MDPTKPFQPAGELREIAGKASASVLPDEDAETLPIPVKMDGTIGILIMYYGEYGPPGQRIVEPPHYAMYLDGQTGEILRFSKTTPAELGIVDPKAIVEGVVDAEMTPDEFFNKRERFLAISADVWSAYVRARGPSDPAVRALATEYWDLFAQITKKEVAPFYVQASKDYFAWLRSAAQRP